MADDPTETDLSSPGLPEIFGRTLGPGGSAAAASPRPARPPGPSTKAALLVLGIAVVVFIGGAIALGLSPSTAPVHIASTVRTAPGAPLHAVPAAPELHPMVVGGQPPSDILAALALPAGTTTVAHSLVNHGVELYDESLDFRVDASQADVIAFFKAELRADGWQQVSSGTRSDGPGIEVLGQHGAVDGNLWDVGIVVSATQFPGSGSAASESTPFSLELYIYSLST